VSGDVVEVNEALLDSPELINTDPYGEGWIIKVKVYDPGELDDLMNFVDYNNFIEKEMEK